MALGTLGELSTWFPTWVLRGFVIFFGLIWGSAVLPWIIVAEDIAAGRLVAPFGFVADGGALAAIRSGGETGRAARTVIRWLGEQALATARAAT